METRRRLVPYIAPLQLLQQAACIPGHISLEPLLTLGLGPHLSLSRPAHTASPHVSLGQQSVRRADSICDVSQPERKRVGRKVSEINKVLRGFRRDQVSRSYQPPKLENVRYRVMRTLKKVIRRLETDKPLSTKSLLAFDYRSGPAAAAFTCFKEYVLVNSAAIRLLIDIDSGPKVDKGKLKDEHQSRFSTYNNSYMEHIFSSVEIRTVYRLFLRFVFADDRPSSLNERFHIWCCSGPHHSLACLKKWRSFREMLDQYLGANLPDEIKHEVLSLT